MRHYCLQRQYPNTLNISEPDLLREISLDNINYERFHWAVHSKRKLLVKECFSSFSQRLLPLNIFICFVLKNVREKVITDIFGSPSQFFFRGEFFSEIGEKTYDFERGMGPIFGPKNGQTSALYVYNFSLIILNTKSHTCFIENTCTHFA